MEDPPRTSQTPRPRATLYRLIEAGQRAHRVLVAPLRERGLEPGDDAVLFLLGEANGMHEQELAEAAGIESGALAPHLERLVARELVCRRAIGPDLLSGLALTERGERIRVTLAGTWSALDAALLGALDRRERRRFDRALKRILALLRW